MKNILILLLFPVFLTAQPVYTYWHGYADVTVTATYGNDSIVVAVDEGTFAGGAYQTGNHTLASFPFASLSGGGLKAWFVCNLFQITRYNPVTQRITLFNVDKPNQLVPSGVFRVFMLEETENTLGDVVGMFPIFADGNGSGAMTGINPFEAACIINHYSLRAAGGSIAKDPTLDGVGSVLQPLKIAQQGAAPGEVLTWDGSTWVPDVASGAGIPNGEYYDIEWSNTPLELFIRESRVNSFHILDGSIWAEDIGVDVINTTHIADGQVQADDIDTDAVGSAEIAANAVGSSEIAADAVGASEIATDAVGSAEIAANAVGTAEIADGAVTMPKIAQSGATTGQVLEWNGTAWAPATDDTGGGGGSPNGNAGAVQFKSPTSNNFRGIDAVTIDSAAQTVNITGDNAATSTVTDRLTVGSNSTGTPANGLGGGILFNSETSTTTNTNQAAIRAAWTTVTHATRTAALQFWLANSGALSQVATLTPTGLGIGMAVPSKPLYVVASSATNGMAVGKNDNLNVWFLGYDNSNNRGTLQSYTNGSAGNMMLSPDGGFIGVRLGTTAPTSSMDINGANGHTSLRVRLSYTPTSTADSNGQTGQFAWDDSYIYIKTSAGWKRAALSTF